MRALFCTGAGLFWLGLDLYIGAPSVDAALGFGIGWLLADKMWERVARSK